MTLNCPKCNQDFPDDTKFCPNDGFALHSNRPDELTGKLFDKRYQILQKIGEGGMGTVYKATQEATGKTVAIKVISKALTQNAETISRFKREVRLQSMLEHPNIVNVIDFVETASNEYYFVMNYIEGKSLKQIILNNNKLPLNLFYQFAFQILNGIDYAHSNNIIHRDLKSDNIIISKFTNEYVLKIMDFGIAKAIHENDEMSTGLTKTGMVLGTPSYMAPEQAKGEMSKVGPRSDIYSIGIIFYQMLSGDLPFHSDTPWGLLHKHIYEPPPPLRKMNPKVPRKLEQIIMKCLEKEPENRFESISELKKQIMKISPPFEEINQMLPLKDFKNANEPEPKPEIKSFNIKKYTLILTALFFCMILIYSGSRITSYFRNIKLDIKAPHIFKAPLPSGNASVKIYSEPKGASIELNGIAKESPALFEHLKADKYNISIKLKGYDVKQIEVETLENQCIEKKVILKRQQGEIQLESSPSNAEIWMDGQKMGITPLTIGPMDIGVKNFILKKENFEERKIPIEIIPDESLKYPVIELIPSIGKLIISPELAQTNPYIKIPEKGKVKIGNGDSKEVVFPLETDLKIGKYNIEIEAQGFEKKILEGVEIFPDKIRSVKYELKAKFSTLLVKSNTKLDIFENDLKIGQTNEAIQNLNPGKHELIFKAQGLKPIKNSIILGPDETLEITAPETQKISGDVYVKYVISDYDINTPEVLNISLKAGDKIFENIKLPFLIKELPIGKHPVSLSIEGFNVKGENNIEVLEGEISEIIFELEPLKSDLLISSPDSFEIWENGTLAGNSNVIIKNLTPGIHEMIFKLNNSKDRSKKINLTPGKLTEIKEESLQKLKGSLRLSCEIKGFPNLTLKKQIKIKIGTNEWKTTPMSWVENDINTGKCNIQIEALGFKTQPLELLIEPDKITNAVFVLEPDNCEVIIKSNVNEALIFENNRQLGKVNEPILTMPFKQHILTVKAQGFKDKDLQINLEEPGMKYDNFYVELEKTIPEAKLQPLDKSKLKKEIKSEIKIKILSRQNKEYANGKEVKVEWGILDSEKNVYQFRILLDNKHIKTTSEPKAIFKDLAEGNYIATIVAVDKGGEEITRENYSFSVSKKMKFYHSM